MEDIGNIEEPAGGEGGVDTGAMAPDITQATSDAEFMNETLKAEPAITDEEFAELDRHASVSSILAKGGKKAWGTIVNTFTGKVKKSTDYIEGKGGIKEVTREVSEEDVAGLVGDNYVVYDKNSKPSEQLGSNTGATFKLDGLKSDDDVESAVQYMATTYKTNINDARRNVLRDSEALELARDLNTDVRKVSELLSRPDGSTANVEEIMAMRQLMGQSAFKLKGLAKKVSDGSATAVENTEFEQAFLFHKDLQSKFMAYRAEAGRGLRAYGVDLGGMGAESDMLDMALSGYNLKNSAMLLANADDVAGVNSAMDGLRGLGRKSLDMATTSFTYSILSGVETQIVNVLGTTTQLLQKGAERNLSELETRARLLMGLDVDGLVAVGESQIIRQAYISNFIPSLKVGLKVLTTGEAYGNLGKFVSYDNAFSPAQTGLEEGSPISNMVHLYGNLTGFMVRNVMGATDGFYKKLTESAEYMSLSYRRAWHETGALDLPKEEFADRVQEKFEHYVRNPDPIVKKQAINASLEATYQDPTRLGKFMQNGIRMAPPLKFIVPFVNTPSSIANQHLLLRNPLRIFNPTSPVWDMSTASGQTARAEVLTGASIMLASWALSDMGVLTGATPTDAKEREQWSAEGIKPNSFKFVDKNGKTNYLDLSRVEGFSYPSSMALEIKRLYENKEIDWELKGETPEIEDKLMEVMSIVLYSGAKAMQDKTYLQGVSGMFDIMGSRTDEEAEDRRNKLLANILAPTVVPFSSLQKDMNYLFSDGSTAKDMRELHDKFKASILFLDESVPNKLNIFGQEMRKVRLTPIKITKGKGSSIVAELDRLSQSIGRGIIGMPKRNIGGVRLTSQEFHDYVKFVRGHDGFQELLYSMTSSDLGSDFMKATQIKNGVNKWDSELTELFIHTYDGSDLAVRISDHEAFKRSKKGQ